MPSKKMAGKAKRLLSGNLAPAVFLTAAAVSEILAFIVSVQMGLTISTIVTGAASVLLIAASVSSWQGMGEGKGDAIPSPSSPEEK